MLSPRLGLTLFTDTHTTLNKGHWKKHRHKYFIWQLPPDMKGRVFSLLQCLQQSHLVISLAWLLAPPPQKRALQRPRPSSGGSPSLQQQSLAPAAVTCSATLGRLFRNLTQGVAESKSWLLTCLAGEGGFQKWWGHCVTERRRVPEEVGTLCDRRTKLEPAA